MTTIVQANRAAVAAVKQLMIATPVMRNHKATQLTAKRAIAIADRLKTAAEVNDLVGLVDEVADGRIGLVETIPTVIHKTKATQVDQTSEVAEVDVEEAVVEEITPPAITKTIAVIPETKIATVAETTIANDTAPRLNSTTSNW